MANATHNINAEPATQNSRIQVVRTPGWVVYGEYATLAAAAQAADAAQKTDDGGNVFVHMEACDRDEDDTLFTACRYCGADSYGERDYFGNCCDSCDRAADDAANRYEERLVRQECEERECVVTPSNRPEFDLSLEEPEPITMRTHLGNMEVVE